MKISVLLVVNEILFMPWIRTDLPVTTFVNGARRRVGFCAVLALLGNDIVGRQNARCAQL